MEINLKCTQTFPLSVKYPQTSSGTGKRAPAAAGELRSQEADDLFCNKLVASAVGPSEHRFLSSPSLLHGGDHGVSLLCAGHIQRGRSQISDV